MEQVGSLLILEDCSQSNIITMPGEEMQWIFRLEM